MSRYTNILLALLVPVSLALAWTGGKYHSTEATIEQLSHITDEISEVTLVADNLYQGKNRQDSEGTLHIAHVSNPSYGGPLVVAAVVDDQKILRHTAILSGSDTRSYLEKVVSLGVLDVYIDHPIDQLPDLDAVSGATLSSTAIKRGVEGAVNAVAVARFGMEKVEEQYSPATPETLKLVVICLFFIAAYSVTLLRIRNKKLVRAVLLASSVIVLGFWFGTQFSLATLAILLNGTWLKGMATYAALLCLVLTGLTFIFTRKNLFCTFICPYGAIQEGIGKISGCSAPEKSGWMIWTARAWLLLVLLAALYFQSPSYAMYGPLGMTLNFIGSGVIYGLTILVVLSSLMFKQPWCNLFCPTTIMISYLRFVRKTFTPNPKMTRVQPIEEIK